MLHIVHSVVLCCYTDELCTSEMPSATQTLSSRVECDVTSEDGSLQSYSSSVHTNSCCTTDAECSMDSLPPCSRHDCTSSHADWRPLLLVIPMRLGLTDVNPIYFDAVKVRIFWQQWKLRSLIRVCLVFWLVCLHLLVSVKWIACDWFMVAVWCADVFHNTAVGWYNWWQTKQCLLVHWLHRWEALCSCTLVVLTWLCWLLALVNQWLDFSIWGA